MIDNSKPFCLAFAMVALANGSANNPTWTLPANNCCCTKVAD